MTRHGLDAYLNDGTPPPRRAGKLYAGRLRRPKPQPPASLDHRRKVEAQVSHDLGWARRVDALALARDCPTCSVGPGSSCRRPSRRHGWTACPTHHARLAGLDDPADG